MRLVPTARLDDRRPAPAGPLQIMYGVDGRTRASPRRRCRTSRATGAPRRSGSATRAADQLQLDIYGELSTPSTCTASAASHLHDLWDGLRLVDWVCDHWDQPDEGIWETRGGRRSSSTRRLMCWVAVDRAMRIASRRAPARRPR